MTVTVDVGAIAPIDHDEAMEITAIEAQRFADAIATIPDGEWARPTPCTRWDVADLVAHVVGSAAAQASPREFVRQVRAGRPIRERDGLAEWWDGMNEVQVIERRGRTPEELADEWDRMSVAALRSRQRLPRPIARLPLLSLPDPIGRQPISYLFDMGFTRDTWTHRLDLAWALDAEPELDAAHDGRIVADIVAEWSKTHDRPFVLHLAGHAGGTFVSGGGGEVGDHVETSVTDFIRCLTERRIADGLLRLPLPL